MVDKLFIFDEQDLKGINTEKIEEILVTLTLYHGRVLNELHGRVRWVHGDIRD